MLIEYWQILLGGLKVSLVECCFAIVWSTHRYGLCQIDLQCSLWQLILKLLSFCLVLRRNCFDAIVNTLATMCTFCICDLFITCWCFVGFCIPYCHNLCVHVACVGDVCCSGLAAYRAFVILSLTLHACFLLFYNICVCLDVFQFASIGLAPFKFRSICSCIKFPFWWCHVYHLLHLVGP